MRQFEGNDSLDKSTRTEVIKPQLAAKFLDASPHACYTHTDTAGLECRDVRTDTVTVIPHSNHNLGVSHMQTYARAACSRMPKNVGKSFLDHPIHSGLEFWNQPREAWFDRQDSINSASTSQSFHVPVNG